MQAVLIEEEAHCEWLGAPERGAAQGAWPQTLQDSTPQQVSSLVVQVPCGT